MYDINIACSIQYSGHVFFEFGDKCQNCMQKEKYSTPYPLMLTSYEGGGNFETFLRPINATLELDRRKF